VFRFGIWYLSLTSQVAAVAEHAVVGGTAELVPDVHSAVAVVEWLRAFYNFLFLLPVQGVLGLLYDKRSPCQTAFLPRRLNRPSTR
jgi:hypothetical protein